MRLLEDRVIEFDDLERKRLAFALYLLAEFSCSNHPLELAKKLGIEGLFLRYDEHCYLAEDLIVGTDADWDDAHSIHDEMREIEG